MSVMPFAFSLGCLQEATPGGPPWVSLTNYAVRTTANVSPGSSMSGLALIRPTLGSTMTLWNLNGSRFVLEIMNTGVLRITVQDTSSIILSAQQTAHTLQDGVEAEVGFSIEGSNAHVFLDGAIDTHVMSGPAAFVSNRYLSMPGREWRGHGHLHRRHAVH